MEDVWLSDVPSFWGNSSIDFANGSAIGSAGGILVVWATWLVLTSLGPS